MGDNQTIFVDSNFFIALFNPADSLHTEALVIAKKLDASSAVLYISNYIFLEIVTILSLKRGRSVSIATGNYLTSENVHILHVDTHIQKTAWHMFQKTPHKNVSFVDCSIAAIMQSEGIHTLLTFDRTDAKKLQKLYRFRLYA